MSGGETFGAQLRRLRVERGMSQNELARQSGVDPAYVNRMERAGPGPNIGRGIILSLAEALDLSYAERDRFLFVVGLAPETDWQTRAEDAEAVLATISGAIGVLTDAVEPTLMRRRTG